MKYYYKYNQSDTSGRVYDLTTVISDSYSNLTGGGGTEINIFEPRYLYVDSASELALKLKLIGNTAMSTDDTSAYTNIINSIDSGTRLYCAVFIDSYSFSPDDMIFSGIILEEYDAEDIKWPVALWENRSGFVRDYYLKAKGYSYNLLEMIKMNDLIEKMDKTWDSSSESWIDDSSWRLSNVSNRSGWFDNSSGQKTKAHGLVSLNHLLRKFADIAEQILENEGHTGISISFSNCSIDGYFYPARWNMPTYDGKYPRYVLFSEQDDSSSKLPFQTYSDDGQQLEISPDVNESILDDSELIDRNKKTIWIDYKQIQKFTHSIDGQERELELIPALAEDMRWTNLSESDSISFAEFLKRLAKNLNIHCHFSFSDNNITIDYLNNTQFLKSQIYLRDASEAKLSKSLPGKIIGEHKGNANYLAPEGNAQYFVNNNQADEPYSPSQDYNPIGSDNRLILTLSPCQAVISIASDAANNSLQYARLPHNHFHEIDGIVKYQAYQSAIGLHSGIYLYAGKPTGAINQPDYYWSPAAGFAVKIDNQEKFFTKLGDYLNYINARNQSNGEIEYQLECNDLFGFSESSTGSSPDWKLLQIGRQLNIDGNLLTITYFRYDFGKRILKLHLKGSSIFSNISSPSAPDLEDPIDNGPQNISVITPPVERYKKNTSTYIADGEIAEGAVVSITAEGKVEFSLANESHFGRLIGFATNYAADGEKVLVLFSGKMSSSNWPDLTIGEQVYLRDVSSNVNISQSHLDEPEGEENLVACLGTAISSDTMNIDITNQIILD